MEYKLKITWTYRVDAFNGKNRKLTAALREIQKENRSDDAIVIYNMLEKEPIIEQVPLSCKCNYIEHNKELFSILKQVFELDKELREYYIS